MLKDYFKISAREILRRKLRSWLTLIGVFIGIAAIVSLITLGQGLENSINEQFEALGKDKFFVTPKGQGLASGIASETIKITDRDLRVVQGVQGIERATGMIFSTTAVEFNDNLRYVFVSGMSTDPLDRELIGESQSFEIVIGRGLESGDKNKAVLGNDYTDETWMGKAVDVGDKILVNGQEFKVIGFWNKIGSPPDDRQVMLPIDTYAELFDAEDEFGMIVGQTQAGEDPLEVVEEVEKELRQSRGLDEGEEDFEIQTPEQFMESFQIVLDIIQIVLIGIAAISLLVGGIGIMNTMYTSVLQRTKEIGVMKALGARNKHIMYLFLIESGLYGLGGGILGAIIGIGFAKTTELLMAVFVGPAFLSINIDWLLILATLIFSFVVGCLSGIAPARKASKLDPVDSLRYE